MSTLTEPTHHPSDETLAALVDGKLEGDARRKAIEHMSVCGECRTVFLAGGELITEDVNTPPQPRRSGHFAALAVAAIVVIALVTVPMLLPLSHRDKGIPALLDAAATMQYRPLEARVQGQRTYRPLTPATRGMAVPTDDLRLLIASREVEEDAREHPSPQSQHALAVSQLLRGRRDDALTTMLAVLANETGSSEPRAAIARSRDAALLNDLAAAYLARVATEQRADDILGAVEAARRAWALKQTAETAWNLALATENLNVRSASVDAWKRYLAVESSSPWAVEARRHLVDLQSSLAEHATTFTDQLRRAVAAQRPSDIAALVTQWPREARDFALDELLRTWTRSDTEVERSHALTAAASVGRFVAAASGDFLLTDTVGSISAAAGRSLDDLRHGVQQYLSAADPKMPAAALLDAEATLSRLGCPLAYMAGLQAAITRFEENDYQGTVEKIDSVRTAVSTSRGRYPVLDARLAWIAGLALIELGKPYDALHEYLRAEAAAKLAKDRDSEAAISALIAHNLALLGDPERAWKRRREAIRLAQESPNRGRLPYVLSEAVVAAIQDQRPATAELLSQRLLEDGAAVARPIVVGSLVWRARYEWTAGYRAESSADLNRARTLAADLEQGARDRANAIIALAAGEFFVDYDDVQAIEMLSSALLFYKRTGDHLELARLLYLRSTAYERLQKTGFAERDLEAAMLEVEAQRGRIDDPIARDAFFDTAQRLYEREVDLAWRRGESAKAFAVAERARARQLNDSATSAGTEVSPVNVIQSMSRGTALLEFFCLPDRLLVWQFAAGQMHAQEIAASRAKLQELAAEFERSATNGGDVRVPAAILGETLFGPLAGNLRLAREIIVVPDGVLATIPFDALKNPENGRFLFEDYEFVTVPSAAMAVSLSAPRVPSKSRRIAAFIASRPDYELFPDLKTLKAAEREAARFSKGMPDAHVFRGEMARVPAFWDALQAYDILHFAGHAIMRTDEPSDSALLLTATPPQDVGVVSVRDILRHKALRANLVVLAGCGTASSTSSARGPRWPISYAFLAANVPSVIGSLYSVEDDATAELMDRFYAHLLEGATYASALRRAKIDLLARAAAQPARWSWIAFELIGADRA
jgi:CHAT domain-containing protein